MSKRQEKKKLELGSPEKLRIGIARACFNTDITQQQLDAATTVLESYNISYDVIEVAGCFEITHALQKMALTKKYNGLVALGCLIKGETIHYDVVVQAISTAIMDLIVKHNTPIGFGIITANNEKNALERIWLAEDATYAVLQLIQNTKDLS